MNPAEDYILRQQEPYRSILLYLIAVIEGAVPAVELKYKYKIPFYYLEGKPFCYLNQTKDYVDVGFWHAAHLTSYSEYLISDGRKVMRSLRYKSLEGINEKVLLGVLQDAFSVRGKKFWKE